MEKKFFFNTFGRVFLLLVIQIGFLFSSTAFSDTGTLPSAIIKLPENENAIFIEKKTQTLFLYTSKANDLFVQFQAPCSTGEMSGVKQKAGDKKTPEGIYFLKDEYEDKYLSPIYGQKAFTTDYPNLIDKRAGKNGSAIWIHGTNKQLKPMDSNGCIALENSNVLKLADYIHLDATPVIVVEEIERVDTQKRAKQEQEIFLMLDQWLGAIETGSYHTYLSFYSDEYLPEINWWRKWIELRKDSVKLDTGLRVKRDKTGIYYHDHVFVILFDYFLTLKDEKVWLGKRKLFLENQNQEYKIIGDIFQSVSKEFQTTESPLIAAAATLVKPVLKKESVIETIDQWLTAWSTKDMDKYASFYAENFYSDGMNKETWVKRKQILAKKYGYINVSGKQFSVKQLKESCDVTFFQEYESSGLTTQGTKKLKLVNKGGLWKIYQESWKEK